MPRLAAFVVGLLALLLAGCSESGAQERATPLRVAVAANGADAFAQIAALFETSPGGCPIDAVIGSTGALSAQIINGAPFDVFLAADVERPQKLEAEGHAVAGTRFTWARGRLALASASLTLPSAEQASDAEAIARLLGPDVQHVALANPETAPYGLAAEQALAALGQLDALRPKIVLGMDVGQTMQFVDTRAAQVGFVAASQVAQRADLSQRLLAEGLHEPILQDAVLVRESVHGRRLLDFLRSAEARGVLQRFGYATGD